MKENEKEDGKKGVREDTEKKDKKKKKQTGINISPILRGR